MERPPLSPDPLAGLLRAEHFQIAYATNDIDRALALFAERYGIANWTRLEGQLPAGGTIRVELAWVGTVMYELLSASGEGSAIYMSRLPKSPGFQLAHHHLGYLIDQPQWEGLIATAASDLVHHSHNPGFMTSCFVDAPVLGHYLEYICPEAAGRAFFENVARN
jgi:Glyoxalase/Bleomycin resistance protein/Dioxygenase superfamily